MTVLRRILSSCSGSTLPVFGVSLMGVFSIVGLAIALNFDSQAARSLQDTADTAALAGATAFITATSGSADDHRQLAYDTADGFARANAEDELKSVAVSAVTTDEYGQHTEVNVILEFHPANIFNRFAGKGETSPVTRSARAIATREFPLCLLALETEGSGISIDGNGSLYAPNCAIWSNSPRTDSIVVPNKPDAITAESICAVGLVQGGATVTPAPVENCQAIPDPLASWTPPATGMCGAPSSTTSKGATILSPGTYCGGLTISGNEVVLNPGLYVIKDGALSLKAKKIRGTGVTLMLSGAGATLGMSGQAELTLTAPISGPLAGLALVEDRTTTALGGGTPQSSITGLGTLVIEGAIYLPNQVIKIAGIGFGDKTSPYLQIIARSIELTGNGELAVAFRETEISVPVVIKPKRIARLVR